ncbi:hypothetical protein L1887_51877 [Cichorium endivia]|nr:hypothetical protein L1887_51877 [Cichorium endivia]
MLATQQVREVVVLQHACSRTRCITTLPASGSRPVNSLIPTKVRNGKLCGYKRLCRSSHRLGQVARAVPVTLALRASKTGAPLRTRPTHGTIRTIAFPNNSHMAT